MFGLVLAQEVEQALGLAGPGSQVDVGEEDRAHAWHGCIVPGEFDRTMTPVEQPSFAHVLSRLAHGRRSPRRGAGRAQIRESFRRGCRFARAGSRTPPGFFCSLYTEMRQAAVAVACTHKPLLR